LFKVFFCNYLGVSNQVGRCALGQESGAFDALQGFNYCKFKYWVEQEAPDS